MRDQCGHRLLGANLRYGRLRRAEQLPPLDGRTYTQRQQGNPADGNRQVDEQQLAGDDTSDEQTNRHDYEKRTEADHSRSPSRSCRPLPTGARDAYRRSREGAPSLLLKPPAWGTTSGTPYWLAP
jgi:hypothetical protein